VNNNQNKECKGGERRALMAQTRQELPAGATRLTDKQVNRQLGAILGTLSPVTHTPILRKNGCRKPALGDAGSGSSSGRKQYRAANDDAIKEYRSDNDNTIKEYRSDNDDTIKEYRSDNADTIKEYRSDNDDAIKEYRSDNADTIKEYRSDNADTIKTYETARRAAGKIARHEAAVDRLKEKGHGDDILEGPELELTWQRILNKPRPEFGNRSFSVLMHDEAIDFAGYIGETELLDVAREASKFMGTRGAHLPPNKHGEQPRNRHVLARVAPNSEKKHFTDKEAKTELDMKFVVVYESDVKLNAFAVEGALQRALQHIPLGRRLWRWVAMGQKKQATLPAANVYKVFITYSFVVQAAIMNNTCIVRP
jgi:hypothetical protein